MTFSLRTKITAAFLAISVTLLLLISFFSNFFLEKQFKDYVIAQLEQKQTGIVNSITGSYNAQGGKWDKDSLESIGTDALESGLMIRVTDKNGAILWDAMTHNSGMCASILQNMSQTMETRYMNFNGGYTEKKYQVDYHSEAVGSLAVGYYGPYFYSANDLRFLDTFNWLLQIAAILSMIFSLLLGALMAKQLSVPIKRVTFTASQIAVGHFGDRIREKSSTKEIVALTGTINTLAETMEKQESIRKRLTADVAHELRTPLATLQSHIEAMIDGVWEADEKRLRSCHEETVRLSRIIGGLEELTRYEGENLILNKQRFDLGQLLDRLITNHQAALNAKGIFYSSDTRKELIEGDEDKISQIFINLISNAIKYTPSGGTIHLDMASSVDEVSVKISDTGIGIAAEDLPFIFERFFRADPSRDRKTGGFGIGLSIAKSLTEAHHGRILAESKPGEGSIFTVILPRNGEAEISRS